MPYFRSADFSAWAILKVPLLAQSHRPQHRSHRALAGRQQRPDHRYLHVLPHPLGKQRGEPYNQARQSDRDGKHALPLLAQEWEAAYRPVALLLKSSPMDKVGFRSYLAMQISAACRAVEPCILHHLFHPRSAPLKDGQGLGKFHFNPSTDYSPHTSARRPRTIRSSRFRAGS
jgi:hypothetical protein